MRNNAVLWKFESSCKFEQKLIWVIYSARSFLILKFYIILIECKNAFTETFTSFHYILHYSNVPDFLMNHHFSEYCFNLDFFHWEQLYTRPGSSLVENVQIILQITLLWVCTLHVFCSCASTFITSLCLSVFDRTRLQWALGALK